MRSKQTYICRTTPSIQTCPTSTESKSPTTNTQRKRKPISGEILDAWQVPHQPESGPSLSPRLRKDGRGPRGRWHTCIFKGCHDQVPGLGTCTTETHLFDRSLLDEHSRWSYWRVCFCVTSLSLCLHDCPSVHLEASNTITVSSRRVRTSTHEFGGGLWSNSWQNEGIYFDSRFRGGSNLYSFGPVCLGRTSQVWKHVVEESHLHQCSPEALNL